MKIILDVMGADKPARELIRGAILAKEEYGTDIVLVGDESVIREALAEEQTPEGSFEIVHAGDIVTMEDEPMSIFQTHKESSMAKTLRLVAEGYGDAAVSAGNTGAYFTGATLIVKRIRGIRRAALGTILPYASPMLLLDCGANADCTAEHLKQFAQMGAIYSEKFVKVQSPRVALANIGTEDSKGDRLRHEAFDLLKETKGVNFIGNVETRDVPYGCCDVLVADGFTGNIILKLYEGVAGAMMANIKSIFKKSSITMLAAMMVKGGLLALKVRMDYSEFGGAPLLGVNGVVIKAHGSSDAKAIRNAIRQAKTCAEKNIVGTIAQSVKEAADAE